MAKKLDIKYFTSLCCVGDESSAAAESTLTTPVTDAQPQIHIPSQESQTSQVCSFLSCLVAAMEDNGFKALPEALQAFKLASQLRQWAEKEENKVLLQKASDKLTTALKDLVKCNPITKYKREQLWARYYRFVTSDEFNSIWHEILSSTGSQMESECLAFYITDQMFRNLLYKLFPTFGESTSELGPIDLTDDELHALGYVGGWLLRSEVKKIERLNHPRKEDLIEALLSFKENSEDTATNEDERIVPEWTKVINRGGLYVCNVEYFDFLCAVETVVKGLMHRGQEEKMKEGFATKVKKAVLEDEEVLFLYSILCANIDNAIMDFLLVRLVESYVAVRGHAFAAQWMELHKQKNKQSIQKTRSFRSRLQHLT